MDVLMYQLGTIQTTTSRRPYTKKKTTPIQCSNGNKFVKLENEKREEVLVG